MKTIICLISVASIALQPYAALSADSFATVETSSTRDAQRFLGSLAAAASTTTVSDKDYEIKGFLIGPGKTMPIELHVPRDTDLKLDKSLSVNGANLSLAYSYEFKTQNARIQKSFYNVTGDAEGEVIATDEPLPLVAWLVIGGIAIMLAPAIDCWRKDNHKLVSRAGLNADNRPEVSLECVPVT